MGQYGTDDPADGGFIPVTSSRDFCDGGRRVCLGDALRLRITDALFLQQNTPAVTVRDYAGSQDDPGTEWMIYRAMSNLIENAANITRDGGTITVDGKEASGRNSVEVSDTGLNNPRMTSPHIFEPFYRVDCSARARQAEQAGPALVRDIVEKHGIIEILSEPG